MENISQGIVLFDYTDQFIMGNERSRILLKGVQMDGDTTVTDFRDAAGIEGTTGMPSAFNATGKSPCAVTIAN